MQKTIIPLDLESLVPSEAVFRISGYDSDITLKKWSLKIKQAAIAHYGEKQLADIFKRQDVVGMADIVFRFMMKAADREKFEVIAADKKSDPDADIETALDAFLSAVITPKDQAAVVKALVATVGIGEPQLKIIEEALKHPVNAGATEEGGEESPNDQSPNP